MGFFDFLRNNLFHAAPLLVLGAIAFVIAVERFRTLYFQLPMSASAEFFQKIRELVLNDRTADAIAICERYGHKPVAQVVRDALLQAHEPEAVIEDSIDLASNEAAQRIQKRTSYLATIANVATLMGLFGTIVGLVQSFDAVGGASAQQRSVLLAAGISTAMNATMLGLGVAIPCMIFYAVLVNKSNRLLGDIQQAGIRSIRLIRQRYYSNDVKKLPKSVQ